MDMGLAIRADTADDDGLLDLEFRLAEARRLTLSFLRRCFVVVEADRDEGLFVRVFGR
jgi:hypothetical protein